MTTTVDTPGTALEAKIDALSMQVAALADAIEAERKRRERLEELIEDAMPLARAGTERLGLMLQELEEKGYIEFASAGLEVVDEVVTNFSADDVRQLGENIVLILETVKEMTQPEMLALLHRAVEAVERQRIAMESEPAKPPSLFELTKKVREPAVRRGLGRALNTLAAVSEVEPPQVTDKTDRSQTAGGT